MADPKVKKRYGSKRTPPAVESGPAVQADEVEEGLVGIWEWIRKYRYIIVGATVGLLLAALVGQFLTGRSAAERQQKSQAFGDALSLYNAPIIEPGSEQGDLPKGIKTFPSETERRAAARAALETFAKENAGEKLAELATLALAAADFGAGNFAGADAAAQAHLASSPKSPLAPALGLMRAASLRAQGKGGDAAGQLAEWAKSSDWWFQAWAALLQGDSAGDAASAKAAWEKGLAVFGTTDPTVPAAKFIKSELERRLAQSTL